MTANARRRRLACRSALWGLAIAGLAGSAHAEIARQGTEYVLSRMSGDQVRPALAVGANGGSVVWQDNATDGDGSGISARLLTATAAVRGERFRVNEDAAGDQQNPQVATGTDGSSLFVWQSGASGAQTIRYRLLGSNGIFKTGEKVLSAPRSKENRNPAVAILPDGSAVIAWTAVGFDGDMAGVALQRISKEGTPVGDAIQANEYTAYNQRTPALAVAGNGFAVAWVSEQQNGENRSDIYVRRFSANGEALGSAFRANSSTQPASMPTLSVVGSQLWVAWSRVQQPDVPVVMMSTRDLARWVTFYRRFDLEGTPLSTESLLSDQTKGDQTNVRFAVTGDQVMAVWSTDQFDGSSKGVAGRLFKASGQAAGTAFVVNTVRQEDQIDPVVASTPSGQYVAVWSDWRGLDDGMELAVQRFAVTAQPLVALNAPIVSGASAWQIKAAWQPVQGTVISHYEVVMDESTTFQTQQAFWESPDVLPASTHRVQVAYVMPDGTKSPLSAVGEGKSWGKDANGDGLPDDWQTMYFGTNAAAWPKATVDSDGDGVSDRNEFLGGTNPKDPNDNLSVSIQSSEQGTLLQWKTKAGGVYQIQSSQDLEKWTDLGGYRFAPAENDSVVAPGVSANSYFRVNRIR